MNVKQRFLAFEKDVRTPKGLDLLLTGGPFGDDPDLTVENFDPEWHDFRIIAHVKGKPVGYVDCYHAGGLYAYEVEVDKKFQRQGVASAMYDWAEELSGKRIRSHEESDSEEAEITDQAKKFWENRRAGKAKSQFPDSFIDDFELGNGWWGFPWGDGDQYQGMHPMDYKVDDRNQLFGSAGVPQFEKIACWYMDNVFKDPEMPMPEFKTADSMTANWIGRCEMNWKRDRPLIRIQKDIVDNEKLLDSTIAHEMIHAWQFTCQPEMKEYYQIARENSGQVPRQYGLKLKRQVKDVTGHGPTFKRWADEINKIKGPDYVTETSDEVYVQNKSGKEFYIFLEKHDSGDLSVSTFIRPSPKIREEMKRRSESRETKLLKTTDADLLMPKPLGEFGKNRFKLKGEDRQQKIKDLWDKGTVVQASADKSQVKMQLVQMDPSRIEGYELHQDERRVQKLIGKKTPPVLAQGTTDHAYLIDGHHRWLAAIQSHAKSIWVFLIDPDQYSELIEEGWENSDFMDLAEQQSKNVTGNVPQAGQPYYPYDGLNPMDNPDNPANFQQYGGALEYVADHSPQPTEIGLCWNFEFESKEQLAQNLRNWLAICGMDPEQPFWAAIQDDHSIDLSAMPLHAGERCIFIHYAADGLDKVDGEFQGQDLAQYGSAEDLLLSLGRAESFVSIGDDPFHPDMWHGENPNPAPLEQHDSWPYAEYYGDKQVQGNENWKKSGWISPKGELIEAQEGEDHFSLGTRLTEEYGYEYPEGGAPASEVLYANGWISVGHAGSEVICGTVLKNRNHPATRAAREWVKKNVTAPTFEVAYHDNEAITSADTELFIKYGTIKAPVESKTEPTELFVDMDGVLSDFSGLVRQHTGKDPEAMETQELWKAVDQIPRFWADMPWMPGGQELWAAVKDQNPTILSAPARNPRCIPEKTEWIEKNLGEDVPYIFDGQKEKYCEPGAVLIDDKPENIEKWREAGGVGILFQNAEQAIEELRGLMPKQIAAAIPKTWYHLTDNPQFKLDPHFKPDDNTIAIEDRSGRPGIYLTPDVERWVNGQGYWRPFVVELEVDPTVEKAPGIHGRYGGEMFVPAASFDKLSIRRVIPLDAYAREEFGSYGWIEESLGHEFDTDKPINRKNIYPFRGYRYQGPDVREMSTEEINRLKNQLKEVKGEPKKTSSDLGWYSWTPQDQIYPSGKNPMDAPEVQTYNPAMPMNPTGAPWDSGHEAQDWPEVNKPINAAVVTASPKMETLKENKVKLSDEEREQVMRAGAVWHHGPNGEETPAIWKAKVKGKDWYCCNTHRAYEAKPTLKGAIKAFEFIKTTAGVVEAAQAPQWLTQPQQWNGKTQLKRAIYLSGNVYPVNDEFDKWVLKYMNIPDEDMKADMEKNGLTDAWFQQYRPILIDDLYFKTWDMTDPTVDDFQDTVLKYLLVRKPLPQSFEYETLRPAKHKKVIVTDFLKRGEVTLSSEEEDAEPDWHHLKSIKDLEALKSQLAQAAQKPYDDWELDENGDNWLVGGGGICHLIVDEMLGVMDRAGIPCQSLSLDTEVHVVALAQVREGIAEIDIPYRIYETGGGYSWKKIPGVRFEPNDVQIHLISRDPADWEQFGEG